MKKNLLYIIAIFSVFNLGAQTIVGTTPENKNVVLEEFTGISCGFCPDGHRIGQLIYDQNPGDVVLINIHTGSYATPQGPGTDFNTSFGSAIAGQSNLSGYPAGTVNRHQFSMSQGGGTAMSRGDWTSAANQILATPSPVNIGVQANVDMSSGELRVDVEMYYTGWGAAAPFSNNLHVAVLQNNIEGPQSGASANPTAVLPNGNYNHQHMLRHLLTGQWGEQINTISAGTLVQRTYTWTLPADINDVIVDPTNLTVAAFVSEGNQEIYTGAQSAVNVNFPNSYDAYCMSASASDILCAVPTTDLEVSFRNYGNIPLTSLDIEYVINGGASNTYAWTGNLAPAATETVTIPSVSLSANLTNTVDFSLSNPNGTTDQNPNNNTSSASFAGITPASTGNATIDVTTDQYANETSWTLKDGNGTVIAFAALGSMTNSSAQPTVTVTLNANECYSFTISDSYGDGIFAPGGYTVRDASGTIIASMNTPFTTEQQTNFSTSPPPAASWDCISPGNCQDPGTGNGQYSSYTQCMVACVSTDINENEKNNINIYPNPVSDIIYISGNYELLEIYNMLGEKIYSTNTIKKRVPVDKFNDGIYIVNITTKDNIVTKKITIEK